MAEPVLTWHEEDDGDWELRIDGEHFGVICPHRPMYCLLVWDWGEKQNISKSLGEGKVLFEKIARTTRAGEAAYAQAVAEVMGEEG